MTSFRRKGRLLWPLAQRALYILFLCLTFGSCNCRMAKSDGNHINNQDNASPWSMDQPKVFVDYVRGPLKDEVHRFLGNDSVNNFKMIIEDVNILIIGATNKIYFLDARDLREIGAQRISWRPEKKAFDMCLVKGKTESECQNHIRILAKLEEKKLLVCGTHAYKPKCRHYQFSDGQYKNVKEFNGIGLTPFDPYHNSSFTIADGELYTATVSDFSGSDPLIYKNPLRTVQSDSKHLNAPDFVSTLSDEQYVYFFFREQAVEYINCGKSIYSRVARVCKSDKGDPNKYISTWTTFLKSRLNCSLPGEYPFYFDHLQSTSDIISGNYGGVDARLVYAVFTTPKNSISGNAICAFRLKDLLETFDGAFKGQETATSNWLPIPKVKEPKPRPGKCLRSPDNLEDRTAANASEEIASKGGNELTEESLSFIRGHSIMDEAVPAYFGGKPIFVQANLQWPTQFRVLAVDKQIHSPNGRTYDVLFVGTSQGRILKILNTGSSPSILIEELILFKGPVEVLKIFRSDPPYKPKLVILSSESVLSVPLARCGSAGSCRACVALQDPYCAWNLEGSFCEDISSGSLEGDDDVNEGSHIQDVLKGTHKQCGGTPAGAGSSSSSPDGSEPSSSYNLFVEGGSDIHQEEDERSPTSSILLSSPGRSDDGVSSVETPHYSTQELSMAVATSCVCALLLGFVFGFLIARARDCSCSRNGENPYHVPYFNQSGYTEDIYAKVDDMTYYPVSSMMMSGREGALPGALHYNTSSATNKSSSTTSSSSASASSGPPQSVSGSKTLSSHYNSGTNRPGDFAQSFGTLHRSQKIYL